MSCHNKRIPAIGATCDTEKAGSTQLYCASFPVPARHHFPAAARQRTRCAAGRQRWPTRLRCPRGRPQSPRPPVFRRSRRPPVGRTRATSCA